jgi:hypothetical protein
MRTLGRLRDPQDANKVTLAVAFGPDDPAAMGATNSPVTWSACRRSMPWVRPTARSQALEPGERVYVLEVTT